MNQNEQKRFDEIRNGKYGSIRTHADFDFLVEKLSQSESEKKEANGLVKAYWAELIYQSEKYQAPPGDSGMSEVGRFNRQIAQTESYLKKQNLLP